MTETTRESLHEALSAVIDGEAEELELRRVLNAVEQDPELRAKWERLHLIGDAMRGGAMRLGGEVADLGETPGSVADSNVAGVVGRGRWFTGLAAAAAVMIAVTLVAINDRDAADNQLAQSTTTVVAEMPSEEDLLRNRLYLMRHAQHSSAATRSPAMTFVKALAVPNGSEEGQ